MLHRYLAREHKSVLHMLLEDVQLLWGWVPRTCRPKTPLHMNRGETTKVTLTFLILLPSLARAWGG